MDESQRANVVIRAGHRSEVMYEARRAAHQNFADDLRRWGLTVDLQLTEYVPGIRGLGPIEWTFIGIGVSAGRKILDNLVDDLYQAAKDFLRARLRKGDTRPRLGFKIYGPDGEELRNWTTEDEEDEDPRA